MARNASLMGAPHASFICLPSAFFRAATSDVDDDAVIFFCGEMLIYRFACDAPFSLYYCRRAIAPCALEGCGAVSV